jgi:hypothetical protein
MGCAGASVYAPRHRAEWVAEIAELGVGARARRLYQQLDLLQPVRLEARLDLLLESHKHPAVKLLRQFLRSVRFGLPCWSLCCRHSTFSGLSASSGLQWFRSRDSRQRRVPLRQRQAARNRERITV